MDKICSICFAAIIAKNHFVCCSKCGLFFHNTCAGVSDNFYQHFIVEKNKLWSCHDCYNNNQGQNCKNVTEIKKLLEESGVSKHSDEMRSSETHETVTNNFNEQLALKNDDSNVPATTQGETPTNLSLKAAFEEKVCTFKNGATNFVNLAANSCILRCFISRFRNNST